MIETAEDLVPQLERTIAQLTDDLAFANKRARIAEAQAACFMRERIEWRNRALNAERLIAVDLCKGAKR